MHHLEIEEQERAESENHYGHLSGKMASLNKFPDTPKIDWTDAPYWARYWAMDDDGDAFWYENKPILRSNWWFTPEGTEAKAPMFGWPSESWRISLFSRPCSEPVFDDYNEAAHRENRRVGDMEVSDTVNHPAHYTQGGIECIEVLEQLAEDGYDFRILNAIKYLWRYRHKGGDESLRKAIWYINRVLDNG